mmetsp:Transcript_29700/g.33343  ORF Transcript_29700/g.33343 Transcript_29700/m.33343 type:complete len:366 (+) Transcript_29700:119-1216(+)
MKLLTNRGSGMAGTSYIYVLLPVVCALAVLMSNKSHIIRVHQVNAITSSIGTTTITTSSRTASTTLRAKVLSKESDYGWQNENLEDAAMVECDKTVDAFDAKIGRGGAKSIIKEKKERKRVFPSMIFLLYAAIYVPMAVKIRMGPTLWPNTVGKFFLFWNFIGVFWTNFVKGIGRILFPNIANENPNTYGYKLLKMMTFPAMTAHEVLIPYLSIVVGEIGRVIGIGFLQSDVARTVLFVLCTVVGVIGRMKFVNGPGLEIREDFDERNIPSDAWIRDTIIFTFKETEIPIPTIVTIVYVMIVGLAGMFVKGGSDHADAAKLIFFGGLVGLLGNAGLTPFHIQYMYNNLAEVVMYAALLFAGEMVF